MLLELVKMLLQERWFAGIDLSDRKQTILEYDPKTRIHEDDELVQRDLLYQNPQSRTQSPVPLGRGTKGSGIVHCLLSFDWSSYCFEVTNKKKADIMLITLLYFLHNFRTKSDPEAINTPRKTARQRSSVGIKCRVCNNDISQDKHRVNLFGKLATFRNRLVKLLTSAFFP